MAEIARFAPAREGTTINGNAARDRICRNRTINSEPVSAHFKSVRTDGAVLRDKLAASSPSEAENQRR